jgi:hypothetical protein
VVAVAVLMVITQDSVVVLVVVVLRMQVHLLGLLVKVMQVDEAAHPSVASMVAVAVVAQAL